MATQASNNAAPKRGFWSNLFGRTGSALQVVAIAALILAAVSIPLSAAPTAVAPTFMLAAVGLICGVVGTTLKNLAYGSSSKDQKQSDGKTVEPNVSQGKEPSKAQEKSQNTSLLKEEGYWTNRVNKRRDNGLGLDKEEADYIGREEAEGLGIY